MCGVANPNPNPDTNPNPNPKLGTGHDTKVKTSRRKLDDSPVDEELRACIRRFCEELMSALNKYYAFGSCFVDDST